MSDLSGILSAGNRARNNLNMNMAKISTGRRISRAADDPAGLAVAEGLESTVRSEGQAMRNVNDAISINQTAEGATNEVANMVKRMRELAVQSSSETLGDGARGAIQAEFEQLAEEVDRIAQTTEFNGVPLTDGSNASLDVQVGVDSGGTMDVPLGDLRAATLGVDTASIDLSTAANAQAALGELDSALGDINSIRSQQGASTNRLESSFRNLETTRTNLIEAESTIRDTDFAFESASMFGNQILEQAALAVQAQANVSNRSALRLLG